MTQRVGEHALLKVSAESSKNTRVDAYARVPSNPSLPVVGTTVTDTNAWTEYLLHPRVKDANLMDIFYSCSTIIFWNDKGIAFSFVSSSLAMDSKSSYMVSPRL
jgi:hypothetical protein